MVATRSLGPAWTSEMVDRLEDQTGDRFELVEGQVFATPGDSLEHGRVVMAIEAQLALQFQILGDRCRLYSADHRIRIAGRGPDLQHRYADIAVVSGTPETRGRVLQNPTALVEVTSPSTRSTDLGAKRHEYLALPSLETYVIVDLQDRKVLGLTRAGARWSERVYVGGQMELEGTSALLDVDELVGA